MSDTMFYGVLRMPYTLAMGDDMSRIQFYDRAQEAADRVEAAEKRVAELEDMVCKLAVAAPVAQQEHEEIRLAGISAAAMGYWKEGDTIFPQYDHPALRDVAKLYAKYEALLAAVPVAQQEPMTDKEITILAAGFISEQETDGTQYAVFDKIGFARAILAAAPVAQQDAARENVASQCMATASSQIAAEIIVDGGSGTLRELLWDAAAAIRMK